MGFYHQKMIIFSIFESNLQILYLTDNLKTGNNQENNLLLMGLFLM
jgi:hypothetical protein